VRKSNSKNMIYEVEELPKPKRNVKKRAVIGGGRKKKFVEELSLVVPTVVEKKPNKRGRKPRVKKGVGDKEMLMKLTESQQMPPPPPPPKPKRKYRKRAKKQVLEIQNLTPDELMERRFREEIAKLSGIPEVLRIQIEHAGSDDESIDRNAMANDDLLEASEEEEEEEEDDVAVVTGEPICPRPAPRKGRGGHKYLKRNMDCAVSQEEVQGMCRIIKNSMRTSKIFINCIISSVL